MPLAEIAASVKMMGEVVTNTREIVKAVNDGREYLKHYYPDAQEDISKLLQQIQRAIEGLGSVTKVISGFRFVLVGTSVDRTAADRDLARLNDYLIAQRDKTLALKGNIRKLKADCDKVRRLRNNLDARTKSRSWGSMFELLIPEARKRSHELHSVLSNFYADDQRMIQLLQESLGVAEKAVEEVEGVLGPSGIANPYNVPLAAQVLGLYADIFRVPNNDLQNLADALNKASMAIAS